MMENRELIHQLAELQKAIGALWKRFDEGAIASQQLNREMVEKLDQWIQTNRLLLESNQHLLQVILENSKVTQRSANAFENGLDLQMRLQNQLNGSIKLTQQLQEDLLHFQEVQKTLKRISERLNQISTPRAVTKSIWSVEGIVALGLAGVLAIVVVGAFLWVTPILQTVRQQANWALIKLERLEKRR